MRTRIVVGALLACCAGLTLDAQAAKVPAAPLETPPGVTLRDVFVIPPVPSGAVSSGAKLLWRYFADAHGKALYTFDADGDSGKATCVGACAQEFPPYLATGDVTASGDWSLVARGPQQRQWAYKGRPVYSYSGIDPVLGHRGVKYNTKDKPDLADFGSDAAQMDPSSPLYSPKRGWRRAAFKPEETTPVPAGIVLRRMDAADGYAFVKRGSGMSLYVLGAAPKDRAWNPFYAPDLAHAVGDFSIQARADGRRQWAYRGQALYSFRGDYAPGELNGLAVQSEAQPALAYRGFMPSSVRIEVVPIRGPLMMTSKGLSLYTETRYRQNSYEDRKALGTRGCVDECLQSWKPLLASAHDQASGVWEIEQRADGARQWSYRGAMLYTYVGDHKPGDIEGNRRIVIVYGDPQGKIDLALTGGDRLPAKDFAGSGFSWQLVLLTERPND
jgi:predicted lipoprotein with Yx(FWY)xxD motif